MRRFSLLLLAATLTFGLSCGGMALAQPPQPNGHFQGHHVPRPDMKGLAGENFRKPDGQYHRKEMRDNFHHDKKDFQERDNHGKKSFKNKMKHDKKFGKRSQGKDFRPGKHDKRPDFGRHAPNSRPEGHRDIPNFGGPRN